MRGALFHNSMVEQAKAVFVRHGWQVRTECRYRNNGTTTYLDLLAIRDDYQIACEVETTTRHAVDNAAKALAAGISLWLIVASRSLRRRIERKLISIGISGRRKAIRVLALYQLEAEVIDFTARFISKGVEQ